MEESKVKLHGFGPSPYVYKVIWALNLKNIEYEYIEEDLSNKSPSLLEYNPVHKKVPVLVHNGRPVAESDVILEYIEEAWPNHGPALLSADPYERAVARFWIDFAGKKDRTFFSLLVTTDENKEERTKEVLDTLKIIQDQALGDNKFFGGDKIGLVDLSFVWVAHWLEVIQELGGLHVFGPKALPKLHQWTIDFKQEPAIKENLPDNNVLFVHFGKLKKRLTSQKGNP
ncbi:Glutathione S-transferase U8 [Striga hermonthica]|uniref:Glutathione S-transferase n=1 Tax=Striga hermonthica TaxID=68872 RepID=A0A9N7NB20_STRHE|nr:Glutathione S-transferase U8 [Striga hermonthica]